MCDLYINVTYIVIKNVTLKIIPKSDRGKAPSFKLSVDLCMYG